MVITSLSVFFLLQLVSESGLSFWGIAPPFLAAALLFWFGRLNFSWRFVLALIFGVFMDSVSVFPFGVYAVSFVLAVLFTGTRKSLFHSGLFWAEAASMAIVLFATLVLIYFGGSAAGYLLESAPFFDKIQFGLAILGVFFWTAAFSILFTLAGRLFSKQRKFI